MPVSKTGEKDKDKESAAYLKRREQVRRAQRTHRERKENYIKQLEEQLFELRSKEQEIVKENEALNTEVAHLRSLVSTTGLPSNSFNDTQYSNGAVWLDDNVDVAMANGDIAGFENCDGYVNWHHSYMDSSDCDRQVASSDVSNGYIVSTTPSVTDVGLMLQHPPTFNVSEVNQAGLAIEFVMTLEKPCLNRATSAILDIGQPTVDQSISLPRATMYHSFLEDNFLGLDNEVQTSSSASLDKLLALSSNFQLVAEVTPIQAWQQIVTHPRFSSIGVDSLKRLVDEMLFYIKCYGFGAVINLNIFNMLFSNVLNS